jgi:two-component system, LytTR family, response regulator
MNEIIAVVVDDENSCRELIRTLTPQLNDSFVIAGEAASAEQGYEEIIRLKPSVVFLDIQMPNATGFDMLRKFSRIDFEVVFISGFDEYAIKAFEYNALDYLLKPINADKFAHTLQKVKDRIINNFNYFEAVTKAVQLYEPNALRINKVPLHHRGQVILLDPKEIMYVHARETCTEFVRTKTEKYTSSKRLSDFAFMFDDFPNFVRISKSCYINVNFIASYSKGLVSCIEMKDESVHEISRRKKTEILKILG